MLSMLSASMGEAEFKKGNLGFNPRGKFQSFESMGESNKRAKVESQISQNEYHLVAWGLLYQMIG